MFVVHYLYTLFVKVLLTNNSKSGYKCIQCAELSLIKMFRGIKSEILTSVVEKIDFYRTPILS